MPEPPPNSLQLTVGPPGGDHLIVRPLRRSYPDCRDRWDGNWITSAIELRAGGFRGNVEASLRAEDFGAFREQLGRLHETLEGEAAFDTMEEWLAIQIVGDGRGHLDVTCRVTDAPGTGNHLSFTLAFDQTWLPAMLRDLDAITDAFPTYGTA